MCKGTQHRQSHQRTTGLERSGDLKEPLRTHTHTRDSSSREEEKEEGEEEEWDATEVDDDSIDSDDEADDEDEDVRVPGVSARWAEQRPCFSLL